jgi:ABC-type multidrug transport system permease subunit
LIYTLLFTNKFVSVMASPTLLPGFWIFMYRVSPLTYLISGLLSAGLGNIDVQCSGLELTVVQPPSGVTCGKYLADYMAIAGGAVYNPNATADCEYCSMTESNVFLASVSSYYSERWRNFGLMWVYIAFNVFATLGLYWYIRVRGCPGVSRLGARISRARKALSGKGGNSN